ncbi:hypothetical protein [Phytomonospora endophytica]|uniref:YkuD domain-containing protein n=1 Tax=Phytomonospora endophytica TaxID=714109 RepID=A0A841FGR1_9ACTN|nr:hypothetical protein [Phytomonospora endophytica]MBB6035054.1 hypothetical protein [Phytomonospora endophytica]GIG68308.1 hypothetical protein Pen01_46030 [Phytomonospora endophytica]
MRDRQHPHAVASRREPPRAPTDHPVLGLQRSAGNRATTLFLQRDWTGVNTREITDLMVDGQDYNRTDGPWWHLNKHNPEGILLILKRMGPDNRARLARNPVDGGKYDKPRLDLAMSLAKTGSSATQIDAMDAVRNAVAAKITFEQCWRILSKMRKKDRLALLKRLSDGDREALLNGVPTLARPGLEGEITSVVGPPTGELLLRFVPDVRDIPAPPDPSHPGPPRPQPLGEITVLHKGRPVMAVPARGGPWKSYKDGDHTADPTAPGTYPLGPIRGHTTNAWQNSQLANGTPMRQDGADVQFQRGGKWTSVTKLPTPLTPAEVIEDSAWVTIAAELRATTDPAKRTALLNEERVLENTGKTTRPLPPEWLLNDFGTASQRVEGSPGVFLHTTDVTDDANAALVEGDLDFSHGCIHILASDRRKLVLGGFLREGVKLDVRPYTRNNPAWQPVPGM